MLLSDMGACVLFIDRVLHVSLARYVMRLLFSCLLWHEVCRLQFWVLGNLGLFKRGLAYDRCHLCEERPGFNSGKSRVFFVHMLLYCAVVR